MREPDVLESPDGKAVYKGIVCLPYASVFLIYITERLIFLLRAGAMGTQMENAILYVKYASIPDHLAMKRHASERQIR